MRGEEAAEKTEKGKQMKKGRGKREVKIKKKEEKCTNTEIQGVQCVKCGPGKGILNAITNLLEHIHCPKEINATSEDMNNFFFFNVHRCFGTRSFLNAIGDK